MLPQVATLNATDSAYRPRPQGRTGRRFPRLLTHMRRAALLTQGEAESALAGVAGEAVSHYGGLARLLGDAIGRRHFRAKSWGGARHFYAHHNAAWPLTPC